MFSVRRIVLILACLTGLAVGSLAGAAAVLAQGTSTSAGDQQYVDPLTGSNTSSQPSGSSSSSSSGSGSSSGSTSSSGAGSSSSTGSSSDSQSSSTLTSGSTGSASASGTGTSASARGTLPFTGMNVWACVAIGVGMLGAGLVLRRTVRAH